MEEYKFSKRQSDVVWLVFKKIRTPLIFFLTIYAMSVLGMVLIPGKDDAGNPYHISFLDATYFVAFMSTTIGFGEIPYTFTAAQRLWVSSIIFFNVSVWIYAIGSLLRLMQDGGFQKAMEHSTFIRKIDRFREPFFIICGTGDTGKMVIKGLDQRGIQSVGLDISPEKIDTFALTEAGGRTPLLAADVSLPVNLISAGLRKKNCCGIVALTNCDDTNLKVAITAKLLEPEITVFARCEHKRIAANMDSFGTEHIIEPYDEFARHLSLAFRAPAVYQLQDWLTSMPGQALKDELVLPRGLWIICGVGRFGRIIAEIMRKESDLDISVVDVDEDRIRPYKKSTRGRGTEADTLKHAGIMDAVGVVACTDHDIDNLSILMTAKEINPNVFLISRQEQNINTPLFLKSPAHLLAERHLIIARKLLAQLTSPFLAEFLLYARKQSNDWNRTVAGEIRLISNGKTPGFWNITLGQSANAALSFCTERKAFPCIGDILKDPRDFSYNLAVMVLLLKRGDDFITHPPTSTPLHPGDELLFCGKSYTKAWIQHNLHDPLAMYYLCTGKTLARSAIWRKLTE